MDRDELRGALNHAIQNYDNWHEQYLTASNVYTKMIAKEMWQALELEVADLATMLLESEEKADE